MENKKFLITSYVRKNSIFSIIFTFLYPSLSYPYNIQTHELLNKNIIFEYIKLTNKIIPAEYVQPFIQGGEDEDKHPRYLNHFLDPQNNKGFKNKRPTSISWATNPYMQGNSFSFSNNKDTKLFEYEKDYTFQRAIYEYIHGNKQRAFEALGHVMHLLEDLTSVPHTRDDAHGGFGLGGNSYYEDYTKNKIPNIKVNKIIKYSDIEAIFTLLLNIPMRTFWAEIPCLKGTSFLRRI